RADGVGGHTGGELQPRHAAEAADRIRTGARAGRDHCRRADGRARPEGRAPDQGPAARVRRSGRHCLPVHPHARGRGGAVRSHRDPAPGRDPRERHDDRAAQRGSGWRGWTGGDLPEAHGQREREGHHHVAAFGMSTETLRQPSVIDLLRPKWRSAQRRMASESSAVRVLVMGFVALIFFAIVFAIVYRVLGHFRAQPGIGDLLAGKLLGMILLAFLSILLLSNIITSLSSFFLARDLELLTAAPVDGLRVYTARFVETLTNSSWMMLVVLMPILLAFGVAYGITISFILTTSIALLSFLILPAVTGTAITQVLVNVFPARRARDLLALIALFGAAALVMLFRLLRPEQLARPEGFRNLVDFIAALRTPQSVWLPSEWAAQSILGSLGAGESAYDFFPLLLLISTAAAFFVVGTWLHGKLYRDGLSRSQ